MSTEARASCNSSRRFCSESYFVLNHKDHLPSPPSIPDSNVSLQKYAHARFL